MQKHRARRGWQVAAFASRRGAHCRPSGASCRFAPAPASASYPSASWPSSSYRVLSKPQVSSPHHPESTRHRCRVGFPATHSKHAIGAISTRHNCTGFVCADFAPASLRNFSPSPSPCFSGRRNAATGQYLARGKANYLAPGAIKGCKPRAGCIIAEPGFLAFLPGGSGAWRYPR